MMGTQHKMVGVGFGIALSMYTSATRNDAFSILALAGSTIGCMLPDIDHDKTQLGRRRAFVTRLSSKALTGIVSAGIVLATATLLLMFYQMTRTGANTDTTKVVLVLVGLLAFSKLRSVVKNSNIFKWATKHRGLMHTLVMPALLFIAMSASSASIWYNTMLGLTVGYCSHLFADMLTVEGCPILFPLSMKNIRILKLKTKNKSTWLAAFLLAALPVFAMYLKFGGI